MTNTKEHSVPGDFPWRDGNHFEVLIDGARFLPQMLFSIETAQRYILLEMYLIESGDVVKHFFEALKQAATRGVQVYLLLDDFGAIGLKKRTREHLLHPNIHITYYNPLHSHSTLFNLYRIFVQRSAHGLHRNHRKLLLVDGSVAFVGGVGLADEFSPPHHTEKQWRETMIAIRGPVLQEWQQLFEHGWRANTDQEMIPLRSFPDTMVNGQRGRVAVSFGLHRSELLRSLNHHMKKATQRIWFATAYFVPPRRLPKALIRAARRGVDVRLLVPGPITDHPGVRYASHRFYARLLRNGVRIFEYQPRFFHAKTILCDDWLSIGSSNFDRWNIRWNLEANQEIIDADLAKTVRDMFTEDFDNSIEITYGDWSQRNFYLRLKQWLWGKVERFSQRIGS